MTEAGGGGGGRAEVERKIVQRSLEDEDFRQQLLEDTKGTLERELGTPLPEGVEVRAVQESADTIYLALPNAPTLGEELSDQELERVAGGGATWDCTTMQAGPPTVCGMACSGMQ